MSAPVDVLEVMDGASTYLSTAGWTPSPSMESEFAEARAAVAELIEEVEASLDAHYRATGKRDGYYGYITDGLAPALTRVKGEKHD